MFKKIRLSLGLLWRKRKIAKRSNFSVTPYEQNREAFIAVAVERNRAKKEAINRASPAAQSTVTEPEVIEN